MMDSMSDLRQNLCTKVLIHVRETLINDGSSDSDTLRALNFVSPWKSMSILTQLEYICLSAYTFHQVKKGLFITISNLM